MRLERAWVIVAVLAGGCLRQEQARELPYDAGVHDAQPASDPPIESPKAGVRFLNAPRMQRSFAAALGLDGASFCLELGQYSCFDLIHTVALLGTEPYLQGVFDPIANTGASTPLVVERVATMGCVERVRRDLDRGGRGDPSRKAGLLFHHLPIDGDGKVDPSAPQLDGAIDTLYVRALQRHATHVEIEHLRQLYRDIEALGTAKAASDWAVASCVAVLTSSESLFY